MTGDILTLLAAALYALSNIGQEYVVKSFDRIEYLTMIGVFGTLISFIQVLALEQGPLAAVTWSGAVVGHWIGFAMCMVGMQSSEHFREFCCLFRCC